MDFLLLQFLQEPECFDHALLKVEDDEQDYAIIAILISSPSVFKKVVE